MTRQPPSSPTAPLSGEPLALELVNTTYIDGGLRGHRVDALTTTDQLTAWVTEHAGQFSGELPAVLAEQACTPRTHEQFLSLREALRSCLHSVAEDSVPSGDSLAAINEFSRYSASRLEISPGKPVVVTRRWQVDDPWLIALGEVASDACRLLMPDRIGQVRACPAPGCILFFVKSHPRREWCSPVCGNRARVARHARAGRPTSETA
ncbi:putative RNA-binding Zn ribbon-like protein [Rhodococcus sp. SMB37]|uniref:CGNR zinc finger domain-containing protein n=1 Tax=Rhodococcus sp. SMB37 TaxID=2512213 RepID=UPI000A546470|nr:CGNR zinc finger domain-containing protein [Rhodococcus sp. SMB37]TCN45518.1 putative RNA-binding Zn ribbon-like protein [Rhodococcus sp. SMB37]